MILKPEQYIDLKQGHYDGQYKSVYIHKTATPDLTPDLKLFADRYNLKEITFMNASCSMFIQLSTQTRTLKAKYENLRGRLLSFPEHYRIYHIEVVVDDPVADVELDYILRWENAVYLMLHNHSDLAFRLSERGEALNGMTNLEMVSTSVDQSTYNRFKVKPLFRHLPSLELVSCYRKGLTDAQWQQFIKNQELGPASSDEKQVIFVETNFMKERLFRKDEL